MTLTSKPSLQKAIRKKGTYKPKFKRAVFSDEDYIEMKIFTVIIVLSGRYIGALEVDKPDIFEKYKNYKTHTLKYVCLFEDLDGNKGECGDTLEYMEDEIECIDNYLSTISANDEYKFVLLAMTASRYLVQQKENIRAIRIYDEHNKFEQRLKDLSEERISKKERVKREFTLKQLRSFAFKKADESFKNFVLNCTNIKGLRTKEESRAYMQSINTDGLYNFIQKNIVANTSLTN